MSTDEPTDETVADDEAADDDTVGSGTDPTGDPLDGRADAGTLDDRLLELLVWVLDTETRARIYVSLRRTPWSTSREVGEATGLYPSTVREALAELHDDGVVDRRKRAAAGVGNNPYEYTAMEPGDLVHEVVGDLQAELNAMCNLDEYLGGDEPTDDPVRITVRRPSAESDCAECDD
jgi:predicted transcriptional regulator